jgi:molecular chaperone IbpA
MNDLVFKNMFSNTFGLQDFARHMARIDGPQSAFPPYNISVDNTANPTRYTLEVAVAGFTKEQLQVKIRKESGVSLLSISGSKDDLQPDDEKIYTHRGLAARSFTREFTLTDQIKVDHIALENGILTILLGVIDVKPLEKVLQIK